MTISFYTTFLCRIRCICYVHLRLNVQSNRFLSTVDPMKMFRRYEHFLKRGGWDVKEVVWFWGGGVVLYTFYKTSQRTLQMPVKTVRLIEVNYMHL